MYDFERQVRCDGEIVNFRHYGVLSIMFSLHTVSETFVHHKKFRSGSVFCDFTFLASIFRGDSSYKPMPKSRIATDKLIHLSRVTNTV